MIKFIQYEISGCFPNSLEIVNIPRLNSKSYCTLCTIRLLDIFNLKFWKFDIFISFIVTATRVL